ncbi:MAG: hypothetical protein V3V06_05195 [Dehalococcoidia bacterium]
MRALILVLALAATWSFAGLALAQTPDGVTVTVSVEREGTTVGDPITVVITVNYPATGSVGLDSDPVPLGDLEPARPRLIRRVDSPDGNQLVYAYQTRSFVTGLRQIEIPAFHFSDDSAGTQEFVTPPSATIEIESVLPADPSQLIPRPLKPPERIGGGGVSTIVVVGPIAGVAALLLLALVLRRLRTRRAVAPVPLPTADPAGDAAEALQAIGRAGLIPDRLDEYCARINGAVRAFLESRYAVPARNLTARELSARLAHAGADAGTVRMVSSLCDECDAVAYARARPAPDRAARYLELALTIVQLRPAGDRWARPSADVSLGDA